MARVTLHQVQYGIRRAFGRSTFGYIAYDIASTNSVYLKEFWRTDLPGIRKGDVYFKLHDTQVPSIPYHVGSSWTRTQDYLTMPDGEHEWCPGQLHVDPYVHY
ncbi:hypothetical protein B0F90DRAFT_174157 [Multifurca ochricompacta]|uniref:Uncharacterized protein n=1 Tax=Multifurca ochricompacta TaxID=376703 RepID=A0AAD4QPC3_9AGAM|nr:hypothetical protein B0F90DRAFT_174157 [Multifurca ochricompacta]